MHRYIIYCTTEQTKKALELGAPITTIKALRSKDTLLSDDVIKYDENTFTYVKCPTAEEMLGWLEEQGILVDINPINGLHFNWLLRTKKLDEGSNQLIWECQYTTPDVSNYDSREEAILAAIDAALDYLIENKK